MGRIAAQHCRREDDRSLYDDGLASRAASIACRHRHEPHIAASVADAAAKAAERGEPRRAGRITSLLRRSAAPVGDDEIDMNAERYFSETK